MPAPHRSLIARAVAIAVVGAAAIVPLASGVRAVLPSVSVADKSVAEGTGGTTTAVFTVTQDVRGKSTINFSTAPGTATPSVDYIPRSGKIRFAGHKLTRTVSVTIIGDALDEADETFFLEALRGEGGRARRRRGDRHDRRQRRAAIRVGRLPRVRAGGSDG